MRHRPIILGMCQPHDEAEPLDPRISGSTGERLLRLLNTRLDVTADRFREVFDRRNVLSGSDWDAARAKLQFDSVLAGLAGGDRLVVVLGSAVRVILDLPPTEVGSWAISPHEKSRFFYTCLPHASGRCRWYNDPTNRRTAALLLQQLYSIADNHSAYAAMLDAYNMDRPMAQMGGSS